MTDKHPKVLVLLAAYNCMQWLEEQVASILRQEGVCVEVWASVDASDDGTEAWFDRLALNDKRIKLLPHGLRFGAAAPNFFRLIAEVSSEDFDFVAFADQDDIWSAGKLNRAIAMLRQGSCAAYSGDVLAFWPDGREQLIKKSYRQRKWDYLFEAAGPGCTYVFDVDCFLHLQRFVRDAGNCLDQVTAHDWFCYAFARSAGYRWHIDSTPLVRYRQHAANHLGANTGRRAFLRRFRLFVEGHWLRQARLIAALLGLQHEAFMLPWREPGERRGYLFLAVNCFSLRRRPRDALLMACLPFMMALKPNHRSALPQGDSGN